MDMMMGRLVAVVLICLITTSNLIADYALPPVNERLVLLLDLSDTRLDKRGLVFIVDEVEYKFNVDRFWMQDRIWSDGICVGVKDSNSKSATFRIKEVQSAIAKKKETSLLVELIQVKGEAGFKTTYLKLFDPKTEYKRYFSKKTTSYDTIKLPFNSNPVDASGFVNELKKTTKNSLKLLNTESNKSIVKLNAENNKSIDRAIAVDEPSNSYLLYIALVVFVAITILIFRKRLRQNL